jgi:hypothetical protein
MAPLSCVVCRVAAVLMLAPAGHVSAVVVAEEALCAEVPREDITPMLSGLIRLGGSGIGGIGVFWSSRLPRHGA